MAATRDVAIDGLVLRQVAENLISNAMKYAPGSVVDLSIRSGSPGYRQLRVEDRGPGIAPARQRELFKPFIRLSDTDPDGLSSGLGLSLAKQILAGSGGQLWYEDREGGGARFVVELPVAHAADADSAPLRFQPASLALVVVARRLARRPWPFPRDSRLASTRLARPSIASVLPFCLARRRAAYHSSPAPATAATAMTGLRRTNRVATRAPVFAHRAPHRFPPT